MTAMRITPPRLPSLIAAILVAASMTAVLGFQIEGRASILRDGTEVRLKTSPVDPRDLFRGDYVVLNYDISTIPAALVTGPTPEPYTKARLWVRLKPDAEGLWIVSEASFAELSSTDGSAVLRTLPLHVFDQQTSGSSYVVDYGIESYYVPEGEGLAIEEARDQSKVTVAVRVSSSGEGQIRALIVDGKEVYSEPLY
ncbi:GDYXXLXY domain-containing protein [Rhizobium sp. RU36D]|uniref:GDYXXLXY domain-containing protein n=1 Tax=Rhizobium sp. RU36D TaxID=1907415 RepID=UPI0009D7B064|nr:GDYXXLXY domain-containing protein [Rhizobium sp. RU36D]SMC64936.1 Uncharacterized membrane-anchored protein [Rhizobium sp. RU36D]